MKRILSLAICFVLLALVLFTWARVPVKRPIRRALSSQDVIESAKGEPKRENFGKVRKTFWPRRIPLSDLSVERIYLKDCVIHILIRNKGRGGVSEDEYKKGKLVIIVTEKEKTGKLSSTRYSFSLNKVDPHKILTKPGAQLDFNTRISCTGRVKVEVKFEKLVQSRKSFLRIITPPKSCSVKLRRSQRLNVRKSKKPKRRSCDDHNPCTIDTVDPETGECKHMPKRCDDGDPTTIDRCDPATGECVHERRASSLEICDGKDNDHDGLVDEDFPDVGKSCVVGVGECRATGLYVCKADGSGVECNARPGVPKPEVCDGKDNDCDGLVDEDCYR